MTRWTRGLAVSGIALFCGVGGELSFLAAAQAQSEYDEIIVTARRREEALQKVPISVSVLTSKALADAGVERTEDIIYQLPNITSRTNAGRRDVLVYSMRGIFAADSLLPQDPAIAIYLNEVIINHTHGAGTLMFDVDSVQALYGPQGTLFGRNATGGAVLITTKKPTDNFEGYVTGTVGNYERHNVEAVVNVPIMEGFSIRAAGNINRRDGFTNVINTGQELDDEHNENWRVSAKMDFSEQFSNLVIVDGTHAEEDGTSNVLAAGPLCAAAFPVKSTTGTLTYNVNAPICGIPAVRAAVNAAVAKQAAAGIRNVYANAPIFANRENWSVTNITTYEVSPEITVKNIFGYRDILTDFGQDLDATDNVFGAFGTLLNVKTLLDATQISDELQVQGKTGNLDWVVGGYYFREKGTDFAESIQFQLGLPPYPSSTTHSEAWNTSYSAFAQATYHTPFLEGLSITGGFRYTWDKRKIDWHHATRSGVTGLYTCRLDKDFNGAPDPDLFGPQELAQKTQNCTAVAEAKFDEPTWTASVDYQLTDNILTYVAHRHGYHAGGFNGRGQNSASFAAFAPETINDVEVGIKSVFDLAGMPVRANLALYNSWYKDLQKTIAVLGPPVATIILNAATARIRGLEFDWAIEPIENVQLSGFYGFVDAVHKKFDTVCPPGTIGCVPGSAITVLDIPFDSPKHTVGATLNITQPLSNDLGDLQFIANYAWRSDALGSGTNFPLYEAASLIEAYGLVNLSLGWNKIGGSGVDAKFFVRNVSDKEYLTGTIALSGQFGFTPANYGDPRTYGAELTYRWGPDNE